jgi:hypothetical protein
VIFQLEDDHSRAAVASHVAWSETAEDAITVVKKGIAACGVPQRLLSDNGMALNPSRRGWEGQLVTYLDSLGVKAITGKPYKPTTQGKNERFHQTLFRWLDKQPLADTLAELQAQVDQFDVIYNFERPHQGLPGRITPAQAWEATPVADPPRPQPDAVKKTHHAPTPPQPRALSEEVRVTRVRADGTVRARKIEFRLGACYAGDTVYVLSDTDTISFFDNHGVLIVEHLWPPPGVTYVGNGKS